jgi:hypothetical protein
MDQSIMRSQVMREADSGEPFDMVLVSCDRKRGTGGELITVKGWQKMDSEAVAEKLPGAHRKAARHMVRNPNHWQHNTINIYNPNNRALHPVKVHFRLIQFFNGKRVING